MLGLRLDEPLPLAGLAATLDTAGLGGSSSWGSRSGSPAATR